MSSSDTEIWINDEAFEFADQSYPVQLTPEIPRSLIVPVRTVGKSGKISLRFPDVSESSNFAFELNRVLRGRNDNFTASTGSE